jgi:hypothetical protein
MLVGKHIENKIGLTTWIQELLHAEHCHGEGNSTAKLVAYNLQKDLRLSCSQIHRSRSQIIRQI